MRDALSPRGILIVEDQEEILSLLAMVFTAEGFAVFQAADGRQALDIFLARREEIGVIITDLGLPLLGGVELIREVRAVSASVRIIGASGFGQLEVRGRVLEAGADLFVPKPFVTAELVEATRTLLGMA